MTVDASLAETTNPEYRAVSFTVTGTPQGKGRPKMGRIRSGPKAGRPVAYTPNKTRLYENEVKWAAKLAMRGRPLLAGPLAVDLAIRFTPPASFSATKRARMIAERQLHTVKPDTDNVIKAILDGCNGIVFADDAAVAQAGDIQKFYAVTAGVDVTVRQVPAGAQSSTQRSAG